jgi:dipeptidyl aminopeptidase/acylaminoacyl peptidase
MKNVLAIAMLLGCATTTAAASRPFTVHDLVMLERASDPRLSPDERFVAYQLRETDYAANKGINGLWLIDLSRRNAPPRRLTAAGTESNTPRWGADGRLYFLSTRSGSQQLWRLDLAGGEAQQVSALPVDVATFRLAPDARRVALSLDVFPDCVDLACTRQRLDDRARSKARGQVYDRLFVRHWDTWKNGTRGQLFIAPLGPDGLAAEPKLLSRGIDGDVPTRPFGADDEFVFTPDGKHVIFTARIAGKTEPWSTDTQLWRVAADGSQAPQELAPGMPGYDVGPVVSPDGSTLAWRSMKRGGFEADRYRIMLRDQSSGTIREIAADWDRSAGPLAWSRDGRTLYTTAADLGQQRLFSINAKSGKVAALTGPGSLSAFDAGDNFVVFARDDLRSPAQIWSMSPKGGKATLLTRHNEARLAETPLGEFEQFSFKGANGETVYGHVMKPASYKAGQKYPVAFLIHGGPQSSMGNHWHYRWNPQTYAGAGYASVFIDFHGSDGYGQAFTDSISKDWGGKPLEDLQKGLAHALSKYDFLDGSRACALGASYGGFMVNWIAGNWPDAFKCLVSHDGIFDQRMMGYATEELWFSEWENGGTPFEHPEGYEQFNPVLHVTKWKAPILFIQGALDFRIPETQGIAGFTAAQRRGIESKFLYFPNENHWVLKPQNSVQWHTTVEEWLKKWIGS